MVAGVPVIVLIVLGSFLAANSWRCSSTQADVVRLTSEVVALQHKLDEQKLKSAPISSSRVLRVVSFNILVGGADGRLDDIVKWIKSVDADVVGLVECNKFTSESLALLAKEWGHAYSELGLRKRVCLVLSTESKHTAVASSGFHVALSSKLQMADVWIDISNFKHALISARIGDFTVMVTHLRPEAGELRLAELPHIPEAEGGELKFLSGFPHWGFVFVCFFFVTINSAKMVLSF